MQENVQFSTVYCRNLRFLQHIHSKNKQKKLKQSRRLTYFLSYFPYIKSSWYKSAVKVVTVTGRRVSLGLSNLKIKWVVGGTWCKISFSSLVQMVQPVVGDEFPIWREILPWQLLLRMSRTMLKNSFSFSSIFLFFDLYWGFWIASVLCIVLKAN